MRALIIGAAGFVGPYLADAISKYTDCEVYATKLEHEKCSISGARMLNLNILSRQEIEDVLQEVKPDYIYHLAAQSSVALSWKNPNLTADINIRGALNLFEVLRYTGCSGRVLVIGSGEEYGRVKDIPITEETSLNPGNIYAITKICQNMIAGTYARRYGVNAVMVRAFNHIGPGQLPQFVIADFCSQAVRIEKGLHEPVIRVGNLSARRDFTDVRDVVRAYVMLAEKGKPGETYNVGSGHAVEIRQLLDIIISKTDKDIRVEVDEGKLRPVDVPVIEADISKIFRDTGWEPEIDITDTIDDVMNYWRRVL